MIYLNPEYAEVFTDGSCHTQLGFGAWASIIFVGSEKTTLSGEEKETTHHRMEMVAVIESIQYIQTHYQSVVKIKIISDSQYVVGLIGREQKFIAGHYLTKKGDPIAHVDLVKKLLQLIKTCQVEFLKIKAHLKKTDETQYNIEADMLSRQIVRAAVKK